MLGQVLTHLLSHADEQRRPIIIVMKTKNPYGKILLAMCLVSVISTMVLLTRTGSFVALDRFGDADAIVPAAEQKLTLGDQRAAAGNGILSAVGNEVQINAGAAKNIDLLNSVGQKQNLRRAVENKDRIDAAAEPKEIVGEHQVVGITDEGSANGEFWKEWGHMHVVVTAFMQNQGNLLTLARARLHLFKAFCFPTMVRQTSQQFAWIIKIDPAMMADAAQNKTGVAAGVVRELIEMLEPYPNFILVGSNEHSHWVGSDFPKTFTNTYSGDPRLFRYVRDVYGYEDSYNKNNKLMTRDRVGENKVILLQTRLDSDDGLNLRYLETVQNAAKEKIMTTMVSPKSSTTGGDSGSGGGSGMLRAARSHKSFVQPGEEQKAKWLVWCVSEHFEWHSKSLEGKNLGEDDFGEVISKDDKMENYKKGKRYEGQRWCITPGLTIGYAPGVLRSGEHMPRYVRRDDTRHSDIIPLIEEKGGCGLQEKKDCVWSVKDPRYGAVRSRTLTSTAMKDVNPHRNGGGASAEYWKLMNDEFGVSVEGARAANRFVNENSMEIARDNEKGQCTEGHSCKEVILTGLLDAQIRYVLKSGGSETVLPEDEHLFRFREKALIKKNLTEKRQWLDDVQAARQKRDARAIAQ